jgi:hypothetical protein
MPGWYLADLANCTERTLVFFGKIVRNLIPSQPVVAPRILNTFPVHMLNLLASMLGVAHSNLPTQISKLMYFKIPHVLFLFSAGRNLLHTQVIFGTTEHLIRAAYHYQGVDIL